MRIIGLDTATDETVVAAMDDSRVTFDHRTGVDAAGRPRHSEVLLASIAEAAESLGGWDRVDRIAVGAGPGTFTGIRIGIATASGIALSTGLPLARVSTLAVLAAGIAAATPGDGPVIPTIDARRGEVFAAVYGRDGEELAPASAFSPEALVALVNGLDGANAVPPLVAGPGSVRFRERLEHAGITVPDPAAEIHLLAGPALCEAGVGVTTVEPGEPLEPIYIREPDAKTWLERDRDKHASG